MRKSVQYWVSALTLRWKLRHWFTYGGNSFLEILQFQESLKSSLNITAQVYLLKVPAEAGINWFNHFIAGVTIAALE